MGFFSKTCAKSYLPILADARDVPQLSNVVALLPNGAIVEGSYDGYGRVDGKDLREIDGKWIWNDVKFVLKIWYGGEKYDEIGPSYDERAQGWFMHDGFIKHCLKKGKFKSHDEYMKAFDKYAKW